MGKVLDASDLSEEARGCLDLRIAELDMSSRATNVCQLVGIGTLGELAQSRQEVLLQAPNCGRRTVDEIERTLAQFDLTFAMRITGWNPPKGRPKSSDGARPTHLRPARIAVSRNATCLEDELRDLVQLVVQDRNLEMAIKQWGFAGDGRRTLESVGAEYGMTRERVRQIGRRTEDRLKKYNAATPWLRRAVDLASELCPIPALELARELQ
ncbi:hypothetical protein EON82_24415, partial [bacterium]